MTKTYSKTRTLVECALMIALGTVLANIKIYELPNGGSVTLFSMLPFVLISFRHGVKWGLFTGFVNSLLQMLLGFYAPPAPGLLPLVGMILLDYVLAFTLLGLADAFAKPFRQPDGGRRRGHRGRLPDPLPVQLPVRRADLGQPERGPARLVVQPDLQRQLHDPRDHFDDGSHRADLQGCAAVVPRAGSVTPPCPACPQPYIHIKIKTSPAASFAVPKAAGALCFCPPGRGGQKLNFLRFCASA